MGLFDWLFGKKTDSEPRPQQRRLSADDPGSATSSGRRSLKVGDRVLARWFDSFFYPGTIRAVDGSRCVIAYDDGDAASVHQANVRQPDVERGSKVLCRAGGGPAFLPATVLDIKGEKLRVRYDNGPEEWSTLSMVRVQRKIVDVGEDPQPLGGAPAPMAQAPSFPGGVPMNPMAVGPVAGMNRGIIDPGKPINDPNWRNGDRVLARWWDLFWYPGSILAIGERGFHILYDDGDQKLVAENHLMPLLVEEGEKVFVRPKNQPQRIYLPGTVTRVTGEAMDVEFEDGTIESNQRVSRARFWRCPVGFSSFSFEEGDRVLATDVDGFTYPAEIVSVEEDRVIVQFLDGPERMLTPELIRGFVLRAGTSVECRWKAGQQYFPGKIMQVEGDRVHIDYDDGDQEWTTVRLLRIAPAPL